MARFSKRLSIWLPPVLFLGALAGVLLFNLESTAKAEFRLGKVTAVAPIAGQSTGRLVTVAIGSDTRAFQTKSLQIQTVLGDDICVRKTKSLIGNWDRYALSQLYFCKLH